MKRLRKFALNLDRSVWPNQYGYDFYLTSRCLCNYIERVLKKTPIELLNSSKLCITGSTINQPDYHVNSSKIACLSYPFEKKVYDDLNNEESKHNFFIKFAKDGISSIPETNSKDVKAIHKIIDSFKEYGYKNHWIHKKKKFKEQKIVSYLYCELTQKEFTLQLDIEYEKSKIFSEIILNTDPDELAFDYKFKDIVIENDSLVVTAKNDGKLLAIPLSTIVPYLTKQ